MMNRIDKIIALILLEAEERESKLGYVADIYGVSMEINRRLIDIMSDIKEKEKNEIK